MTGAPMEQFADRSARSREPLTRTERLLVTMFVTMFATMLGAGALGFTAISGQLLDMQKQIGGVQTEFGNLRTEMHKEIGNLSERITRVEERITRVETLIQTHLVPGSAVPPAAGP